ncbi:pyridoxamine 5'-phosphate oxidase family protein [Nocardioides campestrisoli]|uniref:pyridoxamine 5'-phosphate oxidase family protein n=1 Tax=Nocardioides campestrisoli TaxID=2736757 RepID=UPI00163DCEFE|nr:pyridoxamine 5'-phosphate oxidase family protein [Nocardioides campestrisoli]
MSQHETPDRERVLQIARDARFAMVTSISAAGELHSRPMTPQLVDDDAVIWFLVADDAEQATDIKVRPEVNVAFSESSSWLSIAGHAEVVYDRERIQEFWSAASEAWFPEGPDDPQLRVLKVRGVSAEYWAAPGGRVATLISFVKAKATGDTLDAENEEVDL